MYATTYFFSVLQYPLCSVETNSCGIFPAKIPRIKNIIFDSLNSLPDLASFYITCVIFAMFFCYKNRWIFCCYACVLSLALWLFQLNMSSCRLSNSGARPPLPVPPAARHAHPAPHPGNGVADKGKSPVSRHTPHRDDLPRDSGVPPLNEWSPKALSTLSTRRGPTTRFYDKKDSAPPPPKKVVWLNWWRHIDQVANAVCSVLFFSPEATWFFFTHILGFQKPGLECNVDAMFTIDNEWSRGFVLTGLSTSGIWCLYFLPSRQFGFLRIFNAGLYKRLRWIYEFIRWSMNFEYHSHTISSCCCAVPRWKDQTEVHVSILKTSRSA